MTSKKLRISLSKMNIVYKRKIAGYLSNVNRCTTLSRKTKNKSWIPWTTIGLSAAVPFQFKRTLSSAKASISRKRKINWSKRCRSKKTFTWWNFNAVNKTFLIWRNHSVPNVMRIYNLPQSNLNPNEEISPSFTNNP